MAKNKKNASNLPTSTAELAADPRNPRFITDESAAGLSRSIDEFGDLSGIVWNKQTSSLVAGHQRLKRIESEYGPRPIEIIDEARGLGWIAIDDARGFMVRIVDWPRERQVAANVAANNPKIQGEFTDDLASYVRGIESILAETSPDLLDDLLIDELIGEFGESAATPLAPINVQPLPAMTWALVGIATPRYGLIASAIADLAEIPGITLETTLSNG